MGCLSGDQNSLVCDSLSYVVLSFVWKQLWLSWWLSGKKNLSAMQETRVQSLAWKDPLEKEMARHSSILAWRIPWMRSLAGYSPWECKESDTTEQLTYTHMETVDSTLVQSY